MSTSAPPRDFRSYNSKESSAAPKVLKFVRRVCPDLSEQELEGASERFLEYMKVVRQIYDRLEKEGKLDAVLADIAAHKEHQKLHLIVDFIDLLKWRKLVTQDRKR